LRFLLFSKEDSNPGRLLNKEAVLTDETLKIPEFCAAEKISRGMLYKLWKAGKGPRFHRVGGSVRISHEARTEWRRQLEAEAASDLVTA
jgi:hypothetical protein